MLRFTGHPYIDVGIAAILSFAHKKSPEQLSQDDLEKIADYMARHYTVKPLRSFLTVVFPNSGFTQPAYFAQPEKQQIYAEKILRSFRPETPVMDETDIYLGAPIPAVALDVDGKLAPGRAYRQHIPLLTGENIINFFPGGEAGLPISGEALLAIQAFPLGCAKCGGMLLAVHSDNPEITLHFASQFLENNLKAVQLAAGSDKFPESHLAMQTLALETLLSAEQMRCDYRDDERPFSITAYHLSNSGQGPKLSIYYLPLQVIAFLRRMNMPDIRREWDSIVRRAWEVAPPAKGKKQPNQDFKPRRNYLYEDLFRLPEGAQRFLRTYFLRIALNFARMAPGDPRRAYSTGAELGLVSWKITQEFLRRILNMEPERIEQIRIMGDRLADYIRGQNDKRFFQEFFQENRYEYFRSRLLKANLAHVKRGGAPVFEFDSYIKVFEEGNELARPDWRLARDLVLIRMIERLYSLEWFAAHPDALPEELIENEHETA